MPKIRMTLEEQLTDSRSDEVAYRIKVENIGTNPVALFNLTPQVPKGGELVDEKDSSVVALKKQHERLCRDLTQLLKNYLLTDVKVFQDEYFGLQKKFATEIIDDLNSFWKIYAKMMSGAFKGMFMQNENERNALFYNIYNTADAEIALQKWIDNAPSDNVLKSLFMAKYEQLKDIEETIGSDASAVAMTTIEAGSFYATTYILKFERSTLTTRKFNFVVEGQFSEGEANEFHQDSTSTTIAITPKPFVLSMIAVASAFLGVCLKFSVNQTGTGSVIDFFLGLGTQLITGPGISSAILALLLFNVFEHTSLREKIKLGINWRSALLIGIVCGIFSDRMIEALKVLVSG